MGIIVPRGPPPRTVASSPGDNGESTSLTVKGSSYAQDNHRADESRHCGVCDFSEQQQELLSVTPVCLLLGLRFPKGVTFISNRSPRKQALLPHTHFANKETEAQKVKVVC